MGVIFHICCDELNFFLLGQPPVTPGQGKDSINRRFSQHNIDEAQ